MRVLHWDATLLLVAVVGCSAGSECNRTWRRLKHDDPETSILLQSKRADPAPQKSQTEDGDFETNEDVRKVQVIVEVPTSQEASPADLMHCPNKNPVLRTECMTELMYDEISAAVFRQMENLNQTCNEEICFVGEYAGCLVRAAGHDTMDGYADGCINFADPDNRGLPECLALGEFGIAVSTVYHSFCDVVSLADFIYIAAEAAMSYTRLLYLSHHPFAATMDFKGQFLYGRSTNNPCPADSGEMPKAELGLEEVERVYIKRLGLTWELAAAYMGPHTLGRAVPKNSGYNGWWSSPPQSRLFNNNYFILMAAAGWVPERAVGGDPNVNQWKRQDASTPRARAHQMMLNTDLALMYTNGGSYQTIGLPVLAQRDDCCCWVSSRAIQAAVELNGGEYCGDRPRDVLSDNSIRDGADDEHELCCHFNRGDEDRADLFHLGKPEDCGNFHRPEGVAADAVLKFANDEASWVTAFLEAWDIASTIGVDRTSLRKLQQSCPTKTA